MCDVVFSCYLDSFRVFVCSSVQRTILFVVKPGSLNAASINANVILVSGQVIALNATEFFFYLYLLYFRSR